MAAKRNPTGIRARHARNCHSRDGRACDCRPTWEAGVFLKREGKRIQKTFPTLAAAKAWRADSLTAASRGRLRAPSPITLKEAAAQWLAGAKDGSIPNRSGDRYKPATLRSYERALKLRILPELGHVKLADLRRSDVQDFADQLTADGLSASTVQNTLDPLRVLCGRAMRRDVIGVDPTEGLELRRPRGRRDRIATPAEAARLLAAVPDDDRALWATAMYAGLRRGELRALRWSDLDLVARTITVTRAWDDEEGEQDGKSKAANRSVPIIDRLAVELVAHGLRTPRAGEALVFGLTDAVPFTPSTVRRHALDAWEAVNAKTKKRAVEEGRDIEVDELLVPIGLHEARHTFASVMIAAGVNAKALSTFMGHAAISITFDVYGHLMPGGQDEARELIDTYLAAA